MYGSLGEAFMSYGQLHGQSGPESVNWIDGGERYSFTSQDKIYGMDPKTLKEDVILNARSLKFPGTDKAFDYESFQWSHDSKHIVFKTNTRHIFRRSDISDYYIYDITTKELKQAAKDARSAVLSPDGSMVGMERNGNMFSYSFAAAKEQQLTNDSNQRERHF